MSSSDSVCVFARACCDISARPDMSFCTERVKTCKSLDGMNVVEFWVKALSFRGRD